MTLPIVLGLIGLFFVACFLWGFITTLIKGPGKLRDDKLFVEDHDRTHDWKWHESVDDYEKRLKAEGRTWS